MIDDATIGKFDAVITKEVSRFSRNILDTISFTRQLKRLGIGVIFLNDGISTMDPDAELRLGIMASVAQEESRRTSERVRWGQQRQMEKGVVFGRSLLGYHVENGKMAIDPEGAVTVRRIFQMYLKERMSVRAIAAALTESGIPTKSGGTVWSGAVISKIIRNEKYCGDLLQKKTVTTDYLTHKRTKNSSDDLIYIRDHHEPIISREDWNSAQAERLRRGHCHEQAISCGNRYALSGKIFCAGCGSAYYCRTRQRKNGSTYRVWSCTQCSCCGKRGYIREETLVLCIRRILGSYGTDTLMQGLSTVIAGVFRSQERSVREEKRKMMLTQEKKLKLADCYLAGDIGREEYASLKSRYETELESCRLNQISLNKSYSENKASEALRIAAALAAGEDDETDFYLSLVNRIEIHDSSQIAIILENSPGEWVVEFL